MYYHIFVGKALGVSTTLRVLAHLFMIFELVYVSKIFSTIRNRGLKTTWVLALAKAVSVLELIKPQTIWGEHVGLRPVKSSLTDAEIEQIYAWSHDEETLRWSGGAPSEQTLEGFRDQIRNERWRPQSNQRIFFIVTKPDGIIGRVGLFTIDWIKREGEFGILIDKRYWNKHYGREATELFIRHIFSKTSVRRIYLGTFKDNVRAQHSFLASGFRVIGTASHFSPMEGKQVEGVAMEIVRSK